MIALPLTLLALAATPAPLRTLSLDEALKTATERQPQLRRARAQVEAAGARADQARASLLPQLSATAGYDLGAAQATGGSSTVGASLIARQLIWDFGGTWNQWGAAQASERAQAEAGRASELEVAFGVRSAYFSARAARALVAVAKETLENQEQHLTQIQAFVEVGRRPEIELAQARTDRANARVQLVETENGYDLSRAQLNQAMGIQALADYDVAEQAPPLVDGEDGGPEPLFAEALRARPELASLEQQLKAQALIVAAVSSNYWPSVGLSGSFREGGPDPTALQWTTGAGINLSWSFFEGGRTTAQVREARAEEENLKAQADALRLAVRLEVEQARLAVRASKESLSASAEAVAAARERLRLAEGRYQAGAGNSIELGDAQLALTAALAQQVSADFRLATARAQLLRALGRP